ncbi:MBL fold metallo-hydrolase [Alkaliphilus pronyensis]|uniref:MBL fold metallo-hydrolase n=1 Tax=Alkaliphilus pronyensis TaxID=1482732 RepID=A0A6I0FA91_9FIRM|nr:MBL fold metallo-hydrolase [Alkaliphilus pronyensis]KAB3534083.1 MBL fold metallo-hydrolase [Alkaliphilus pronyensis]
MRIHKIIVGINETNTHIVFDENTMEAIIIDPGDEASTINNYITKNSLKPKAIIISHYHHDHIGAAEDLKEKYNSPIYAHKKELAGLKNPEINRSIITRKKEITVIPDKLLKEGDTIEVGEIVLEVIHTPGHTPGGISLKVKDSNIVFTGDTIFSDALGRTDLAGGDEGILKRTIVNKVSRWGDDIIIYPGHGDSTTMKAARKRKLQYLKALT